MSGYLLIESRDPFESRSFSQRCALAAALADDGDKVTIFLVENAVLAARAAAHVRELEHLGRLGVDVLADEFALSERGIAAAQLAREVRVARIDALVVALGTGVKAMWN